MLRFTLALLALLTALLPTHSSLGAAIKGGTLITGVTVLSPELDEPLENAWVGLRDGRIAFLGQGEIPAEAEAFKHFPATGRFLIPGLIDSHVHLGSVPGMAYPQQQAHGDLVAAYRKQLPRSYLYYGFTALVDLAPGDLGGLEELRHSPAAPDIFACGQPLPLANGYPMIFLPPKLRFRLNPNFLYDPRQADEIPKKYRAEDHSPKAAVERAAKGGGICVKTFVEDGFGRQKIWPVPTAELLGEVKKAAASRGLPVAVHANSFDSYTRALAGADILVHGLWAWDAHQDADDGGALPRPLQELTRRVISSGTAVMPTLQVLAGDRALFDPKFLADPRLAQVLPPSLLEWYRSEEGGWFARQLLADYPPGSRSAKFAYDDHTQALSRGERAAAYLARQGGRILFGSDTPSGPSYGNPPGLNGFLELQRLAKIGLPLDRLLAAATLENAKAFHLDDRYGSVTVGKVANLLLLKKNPLKTVEAYDSIETVILHGRPLQRKSLAAKARAD